MPQRAQPLPEDLQPLHSPAWRPRPRTRKRSERMEQRFEGMPLGMKLSSRRVASSSHHYWTVDQFARFQLNALLPSAKLASQSSTPRSCGHHLCLQPTRQSRITPSRRPLPPQPHHHTPKLVKQHSPIRTSTMPSTPKQAPIVAPSRTASRTPGGQSINHRRPTR